MLMSTIALLHLLLFITSCVGAMRPTILTGNNGAICQWVQKRADNDADSFVKLIADESIVGYKIPALIFNYQDIANFSSVPTIETFTDLYRANKTDLYPRMLSEGVFNLDAAEGHSVNKSRFWSGIIDKEITFRVPVSGIYCVYIAPDPMKVPDFELPIYFKNYYGNLDYAYYVHYTGLKWLIIVFAVLIVAMQKLVKVEDAKGAQSLSSVKAITNTLVYLTLISFIVVQLFQFFKLFMQNSVLLPYQKSSIGPIWQFVSLIANHFHDVFELYLGLLFSMGLGVTYYYTDVQNYREFPSDWLRKTIILFMAHCLIMFLRDLCLKWSYNIPFIGTARNISSDSIATVLDYTQIPIYCIWYALSAVFYLKTKKKLTLVPPNLDMGSTENVVSAFKKTTLVIWIVPSVIYGLGTIFMGLSVFFYTDKNLIIEIAEGSDRAEIYMSLVLKQEKEIQKMVVILGSELLSWISTFLSMSAIYLIWVSSSNRATIDRKVQ
ncbi:hypothetical protein CANMA_003912 [Candida margitis]|uniref:uncharacterized protein n=1 Tax=Candida margitis TaxID=1775924 RepID=UPI0022278EFF|nr:uncharacterized protein CANMA_003912 [Candida margitis]KAI5961138.1 hypothetical protein CANMA_003912 [Candida margitis]